MIRSPSKLALVATCALLLSACLPSEDYVERTSDAGSSANINQSKGVFYASLLPTAAQRITHAVTQNITATNVLPAEGFIAAALLQTGGYDPSTMGSSAQHVKAAYCSGRVLAWIDSSAMDTIAKASFTSGLNEKTAGSNLGTVESNAKINMQDGGADITLGGNCTRLNLVAGTPVMVYPVTLPQKLATQSLHFERQDVSCTVAGFNGYSGKAKQKRPVFANGTTGEWVNEDLSDCHFDVSVDANIAVNQSSINTNAAQLSKAMATALENFGRTGCVDSPSAIGKKRIKKDENGNVLKDAQGNIVYELETSTELKTCGDVAVTSVAQGYGVVGERTETEKKVLACSGGGGQLIVGDSINVYTALPYTTGNWTGTYTAKRTNIIYKLENGEEVKKLGVWKGDTIGCQRRDNAKLTCASLTPSGYAATAPSDYAHFWRGWQTNYWADADTFKPLIQSFDWVHESGTCEFMKVEGGVCTATP